MKFEICIKEGKSIKIIEIIIYVIWIILCKEQLSNRNDNHFPAGIETL